MNREIKFRAWIGDRKSMKEVITYIKHINGFSITYLNNSNDEILPMNAHTHSIALMQYTDSKDKNGKEIYEGDIIKCYETVGVKGKEELKEWVSEICYRHASFALVNKSCCEHCKNGFGITMYLNECFFPIEVIGNIYENPELLEGK